MIMSLGNDNDDDDDVVAQDDVVVDDDDVDDDDYDDSDDDDDDECHCPVQCYNETKTLVVDTPVEECELEPRQNCRHATKQVPKLV